jgi:predicted kinase
MFVWILVGIPGAGKSTWAKEKAKDGNTIIISRDDLRYMIKGEYIFDMRYEPLIKEMSRSMIADAMRAGFDIIIDETNITKRQRTEIIEFVKDNEDFDDFASIIAVVFEEKENNLENRMREPRGLSRDLWESVINKMKDNWEDITDDERFVKIINIEGRII